MVFRLWIRYVRTLILWFKRRRYFLAIFMTTESSKIPAIVTNQRATHTQKNKKGISLVTRWMFAWPRHPRAVLETIVIGVRGRY